MNFGLVDSVFLESVRFSSQTESDLNSCIIRASSDCFIDGVVILYYSILMLNYFDMIGLLLYSLSLHFFIFIFSIYV